MRDPLPWLIVLPLLWAGLALVLGPGRGAVLALTGIAAQLALAFDLARDLLAHGPVRHAVGGWGAPLGIDLAADGLSAVLLLLAQAVALPLAIFARVHLGRGSPTGRHFWPLCGFLLAGMNALFLSADLFNLYVTLEIVGLAAVGLVAAGGEAAQVRAALRYLFATLLGSGAYLLGVALVYGAYGTVSIETLAPLVEAAAPHAVWLAAGLMLLGLLVKTALFPFHGWLPPAHGSAPAPVSALLSALVVKASFYLVVRLWTGPFAPLSTAVTWLPALLGTGAILWGSLMAIRAPRLKALVAYSTVAQLGYLFLVFPLLGPDGRGLEAAGMHAVAHGLAKAAMFLAAGVLVQAMGRDRIDDLSGAAWRSSVAPFAFGLAGFTLCGLPPSSGFLAKWVLIDAALDRGHWPLAAVAIAGGLLATVYVFRVLRQFLLLTPRSAPLVPVPPVLEWTAFGLASASVLLGLRGVELMRLLAVGGNG
jgi:multicomponent Na+:H+ antiporter subunit D